MPLLFATAAAASTIPAQIDAILKDYGRADAPKGTSAAVTVQVYDPEAFGSFAENFARFMGTARFLLYMTGFVVIWLVWNYLAPPAWQLCRLACSSARPQPHRRARDSTLTPPAPAAPPRQ